MPDPPIKGTRVLPEKPTTEPCNLNPKIRLETLYKPADPCRHGAQEPLSQLPAPALEHLLHLLGFSRYCLGFSGFGI